MQFYEWLTQQYIKWRGDAVGRDKTISAFAEWIGLPQPTMSNYMKKGGRIPQSLTVIQKFANRFGPEVYDILQLPPQPLVYDILQNLPHLVHDCIEEYTLASSAQHIAPNTPEADDLIIEILKKHGFKRAA